jgi:hypothetical protein
MPFVSIYPIFMEINPESLAKIIHSAKSQFTIYNNELTIHKFLLPSHERQAEIMRMDGTQLICLIRFPAKKALCE